MGGKARVRGEFGSLHNLATHLLLAFLHQDLLPADELDAFLSTPIQVRLDTS
jgi:hypothetical protein